MAFTLTDDQGIQRKVFSDKSQVSKIAKPGAPGVFGWATHLGRDFPNYSESLRAAGGGGAV